jgi:hypothetical protein
VLRRLFEGSFVVALRDARGRVVARRPLIVAGAGGPWSTTLSPRGAVRGRGTAEVVVGSAKDAGLECLVQVPVVL